MSSAFAKLERVAHQALDRVFAEALTITAQAVPDGDVNRRKRADPSRQPMTLQGVFLSDIENVRLPARGASDAGVQPRTGNAPVFDVATGDLAWVPQEGDLVTRLATGAIYQIAKAPSDVEGRTFLHLTARR